MDTRQSWCLGFSVAITFAAIGSIATLTDASFEPALAADLEAEGAVPSAGSGAPAFSPVIDLPTQLQAGATTNVTVQLLGFDHDRTGGSPSMVQVDLELELVGAARGWVRIPRDRHLVAPGDLPHRSFALQVAPAAPCGIVPGRLTVTVTAADGTEGSGDVRQLLPPIACDQLPPIAPASLHAPAGSCADFNDERPLAAAVVEPPGCNVPVRPRAPRPRDTTPTDDATDEPDVDEPDEGTPEGDTPEGDEGEPDQPDDGSTGDTPDAPDAPEEAPDGSSEGSDPAPTPRPDDPSGDAEEGDDADAPDDGDGSDGSDGPTDGGTASTSGSGDAAGDDGRADDRT